MSPVQSSPSRDPRSLGLAVGGLVLGVVLLVALIIFVIPRLTETGSIRVGGGSGPLDLGNARVKADLIARDGPFTFADPTGGSRDIIIQHRGDDPLTGWLAFDARRPGTARDCTLRWDTRVLAFTDPCGGPTVPAGGGDLPHYPVEVNGEEQLSVRLVAPATAPSTTILVTGSSAPR
jgi:hypothetical protein